MINRNNWKLVREFLEYRAKIEQVSLASIRLDETWLKHLLEWADSRSFEAVNKITPTFPEYVLAAQKKDSEEQFSNIYIRKVIGASKRFFEWLVMYKPGYNHKVKASWIDTLRVPRLPDNTKEHEAVTIEEIRAIAAAPVETLRDRRIRAAAVFWFLSGIRIGAFVSLPIKAVNLDALTIYQWPVYGVKTKFGKRGTTYLLNIPDLLEVVWAWDKEIRTILPDDSFWFAALSSETGEFDRNIRIVGQHRKSRANKDLRDWLARVGLPYHSPHKFRHGNAVYSLKVARNLGELKAISQNLMHKDIRTTDGIYGILSEMDMQQKIAGLGMATSERGFSKEDLDYMAEAVAKRLNQKSP